MADETVTARRPWHLWAVGVASLLWNCGGALDVTMSKLHLAAVTPEQRAWFDSFPLWANTAWAAGVWGAFLGSLLLLAASRWAVAAFAVSLAGLVVGTVYQYGMSDMPASLRTGGGITFTAMLWIVAILLLWYAARMRARGVLR